MGSRASIFILKNRFRLFKGTLRHSWQAMVGVFTVAAILLYQILFAAMKVEIGKPVGSQYIQYFYIAVTIVNFLRVLISKTPVFRMNAATLHYTYNTELFDKTLYKKQAMSLLKTAIISFLISLCINGFYIGNGFAELLITLIVYIHSCTLMAWIFYHGKKAERICILAVFVAETALLFLFHTLFSISVFVIILTLLEVYILKYLRLNVSKYYEKLQTIDTINAAQSQNNFVKMQQLAEENRPQSIRGLSFRHLRPSKCSALTAKSLIELFRMQKQVLIMLMLVLMAGWVFYSTNLLGFFLPFLGESSTKGFLAALCTAAGLSALYQILAKQMKTVTDKRLLGLSLPFSTGQILLGYMPVAMLINLLLTVVLGILYNRLSLISLVFFIIANIVYLLQSWSQAFEKKLSLVISAVTNLLLWAGVYWYLIL